MISVYEVPVTCSMFEVGDVSEYEIAPETFHDAIKKAVKVAFDDYADSSIKVLLFNCVFKSKVPVLKKLGWKLVYKYVGNTLENEDEDQYGNIIDETKLMVHTFLIDYDKI